MPRSTMSTRNHEYEAHIADGVIAKNALYITEESATRLESVEFTTDEDILALYIFLTNNFSHLFKDKDGKPL